MVPLPLTGHIRRRSFWFVTLAIIIANVWVFFFELAHGPNINRLLLSLESSRRDTSRAMGSQT
jgi:uncharacterized membrane protein YhaH (DUF805 family)